MGAFSPSLFYLTPNRFLFCFLPRAPPLRWQFRRDGPYSSCAGFRIFSTVPWECLCPHSGRRIQNMYCVDWSFFLIIEADNSVFLLPKVSTAPFFLRPIGFPFTVLAEPSIVDFPFTFCRLSPPSLKIPPFSTWSACTGIFPFVPKGFCTLVCDVFWLLSHD